MSLAYNGNITCFEVSVDRLQDSDTEKCLGCARHPTVLGEYSSAGTSKSNQVEARSSVTEAIDGKGNSNTLLKYFEALKLVRSNSRASEPHLPGPFHFSPRGKNSNAATKIPGASSWH